MAFLTWTLVAVVCAAVYYYFKKKLSYFEERRIPYVPGWPLLGNMASMFFRTRHVSEVFQELYDVNPEAKYVGTFDFMTPSIVLRDPELIKSITIKNFDSFPDHKVIIDVDLDPLFAGNLFSTSGEKWKEARALLSPAFTSSKMKTMHELIVVCGENFVEWMAEQPDEKRRMVATKDLFTKYTNDVIATCAFGISVDSLKEPNNEFYVLGREATKLDGIFTFKIFLYKAFPWFVKILKIKFISKKVVTFFENVVSTTVKTRDEKGISRPDMLQLMMDARGKESKHLKLDIKEMTAQAFIFFFGGFDTTSTQMCIIAHELALNPDIQKRLQAEIDKVLSESSGKPTYEAITSMLYLDAVFRESMRRHTQLSFIDRLCTKAFELPPAVPGGKPYVVEPGTNILIPTLAIHMDPQYYENPEKFNPDRYYGEKMTINDSANLGFGIGPRACIGNRFAILETKILFFYLLSKFNLKPNAKTCIPLKYDKTSFSVNAEGGFWLSIEPRD